MGRSPFFDRLLQTAGRPARWLLASWLLTHTVVAAPQEPADENPILGAPADIRPPADDLGDRIWAEPGTRLYGQPDVRSSSVATIDSRIELAVLERRGRWVRVRYGSWRGWIPVERPEAPVGLEPAVEVIARRLALAREILGPVSKTRQLGPFALLTDVDEAELLRRLAAVAGQLPEAYRERFELDPRTGTKKKVILFTREKDYRAYEAAVRPETHRGALGHADQGLAVLYVGRQSPDDVTAVLVHELTHVLNRLALRKQAPPWLDEGMANDLAFCRIDGARRLELGSLGGRRVVVEQHSYRPGGWLGIDQAIHLSGPVAAFNSLRKLWGDGGALSLERVAELHGGEFFDAHDRQVRYDISAFFIRYLLDGEDGELAAGFRAFLASLAADEAADPAALPSFLESGWPQLESGFAAWLARSSPG